MKLLFASGNAKKAREVSALLAPLGIELLSPADIGGLPEVDEDRPTFAGNAAKKAREGAAASGQLTLADDSGLEVDALGGAPGVRSARFSGPDPGDGLQDERNNDLLLEKLRDVPDARRGARFVCALAIARPDGELVAEVEGTAAGRILHERRGDRDFGYDPLFLFTEEGFEQAGRTFAEIPLEAKAAVSHRGRALALLADRLPDLIRDPAAS